MPTPVTVDELAAKEAGELVIAARQQACNILSMAYEIAQREIVAESNDIPHTRKIQVVNSLFEDGLISEQVRNDVLLNLGFPEMDPV